MYIFCCADGEVKFVPNVLGCVICLRLGEACVTGHVGCFLQHQDSNAHKPRAATAHTTEDRAFIFSSGSFFYFLRVSRNLLCSEHFGIQQTGIWVARRTCLDSGKIHLSFLLPPPPPRLARRLCHLRWVCCAGMVSCVSASPRLSPLPPPPPVTITSLTPLLFIKPIAPPKCLTTRARSSLRPCCGHRSSMKPRVNPRSCQR